MSLSICSRPAFHTEAQWQRVCAVCRKAGPFQAHHVLYEQVLSRELGIAGRDLFDTRNALRLCMESVSNCHARHHWKVRAVRTVELTDDNLSYVMEKMGEARGVGWLRRYYDDVTQPDPRLEEYESVAVALR